MLDRIVTQDRETISVNQSNDILHLGENNSSISGEFTDIKGERYYVINNVDKMSAFFISLVSDSDHWLFVSSNGGLTAGRVSPESALFPYVTVDKIHENTSHTGSKTLLRVHRGSTHEEWEPFNMEHDGRFQLNRNLYKNLLGNKLCFEEINHDLQLVFRYTWMNSDSYGFIRECELHSLADQSISIDMIDGLQNILPAGTPRKLQDIRSNLVDAYKWNELDQDTGVAFFTLNSGITDRPDPCESLQANTVFCLGLDDHKVLLSSQQLDNFRLGYPVQQEAHTRGIRGSYLVNTTLSLEPKSHKCWRFVANVEQSQRQVVKLLRSILANKTIELDITESVDKGSEELKRIVAAMDGFQSTAEENVTEHHYANVLFNGMRGGVFDDQYRIYSQDYISHVHHFNSDVYNSHKKLFQSFPEKLEFNDLLQLIKNQEDPNLERLSYEYLPLTFGRRHGDPSRPWNEFAIELRDDNGNRLLNYQGNWRDIFQNWEALSLSYPEFIENIIVKFVNASTIDGYNPYRITKEGIDWEVEDPEDPWSYIGYWGDHQIIYLLKLLELSNSFHPERLGELLHRPIFGYADVPYRIKSFQYLLKNPKDTVEYHQELADRIENRVSNMGADGKLLQDRNGEIYLVNLLEKLLVPLLSKLSNLVLDGGIWLNTQRPEWNDANNALVGNGLSMVTLYYLRRYINFLQNLLENKSGTVILSKEVSVWLAKTSDVLENVSTQISNKTVSDADRLIILQKLGLAASEYRELVYAQESFSAKESVDIGAIKMLLDNAQVAIDHSIVANQRQSGMYHAYNLLNLDQEQAKIDKLYPMLEGQVAALSSGAIDPKQAISVLEALFETDLYRPDQHSFMLYPDRKLPGFLEKNQIPKTEIMGIPLLQHMLDKGDESIVCRDVEGSYRFSADLINKDKLDMHLNTLSGIYGKEVDASRESIQALYEKVFNHKEFTGRSGGMFGFEGLGCIYWHMVSKLLLAVQEMYFTALDQGTESVTCDHLGQMYYRVREGIGFNKSPTEYGAFPMDPYSHTPKHAGAQQPGMTGQVKEEILTRFGELGIRVNEGKVRFQPNLLRECEFVTESQSFEYLDVAGDWRSLEVPKGALAFTWCQVPVVYISGNSANYMTVEWQDGEQQSFDELTLSSEISKEIFTRSGKVKMLELNINNSELFHG